MLIPEDLPVVRCRSHKIQHVLINLITNTADSLNTRYPDSDDDKFIMILAETIDHAEDKAVRVPLPCNRSQTAFVLRRLSGSHLSHNFPFHAPIGLGCMWLGGIV